MAIPAAAATASVTPPVAEPAASALEPPAGAPESLLRLTLAQNAHLSGQTLANLGAGRATFLPAETAAR